MGGLYMEITKMDLFRILQGRKKGLLLTFIAFSIFANAQLVTYPEGLKAGSGYVCRVENGKTCLNIMSVWIWTMYNQLLWYSLIWAVLLR